MSSKQSEQTGHLTIENIGGIEEEALSFSEGITVLAGENATNRTSVIEAVGAAIGADTGTVRGKQSKASVKLTIGGDSYTRTLTKRGDTIEFGGEPWIEDASVYELFGHLVADNEARLAVETGGDLRAIVMDPVDTDEIESRLSDRVQERDNLREEIEELETLKDDIPALEERKNTLSEEIQDLQKEVQEKRQELESLDTDSESVEEIEEELEEKLNQQHSLQNELDDVREKLSFNSEVIQDLQESIEKLEEVVEQQEDIDESRIQDLESQQSKLRDKRQSFTTKLNHIDNAIEFNQTMLANEGSLSTFADTNESDPSKKLISSSTVTCWSCGSEVNKETIEATLETLKERRSSLYEERTQIDNSLSDISTEIKEIESQIEQQENNQQELETARTKLENYRDEKGELHSQKENISQELEVVKEEVENLKQEERDEYISTKEELSDLEHELGQLRDERAEVAEKLDDYTERVEQIPLNEGRIEELKTEIVELRTHVTSLEEKAVEEFNKHMDELIDILEYTNLSRVWIERNAGPEGKPEQTTFDLNIVRTDESGSAYESHYLTMSESEREVTGIVFALAGYLTHQVYETVPVMTLDSTDALDSMRAQRLFDHLAEHVDYLFTTTLSDGVDEISQADSPLEVISFSN